jgi:arsenate reductase
MCQTFFDTAAAGMGLCARSAGTRPARRVDPTVVDVMAELGHDLSGRRPSPLTTELAEWADLVVTMGCGDSCPFVPGTRYIDWDLTDPAGLSLDEVRVVRDEIRDRIESLIVELTSRPGPSKPEEGTDGY